MGYSTHIPKNIKTHSEISIIHQREKFNKKLETLGRLFLGKEGDIFYFEDEENIIQLIAGIYLDVENNKHASFIQFPSYDRLK